MSKKNRIRLFMDIPLAEGQNIECSEEHRHYLINVMRRQLGDQIFIFNGSDGEFCAKILEINKKKLVLQVMENILPFEKSPDIWLLFAPLKKDNMDFAVSKAVELGVSKLLPVFTEYTTSDKVRTDRLMAQAVEAAEQSRRLDVPEINPLESLTDVLNSWPQERTLIFFDETGAGNTAAEVLPKCPAPAALLVGPEGGFSEKELEMLRNLKYTESVSLGKRILRAETACVAALACWQALSGDWK